MPAGATQFLSPYTAKVGAWKTTPGEIPIGTALSKGFNHEVVPNLESGVELPAAAKAGEILYMTPVDTRGYNAPVGMKITGGTMWVYCHGNLAAGTSIEWTSKLDAKETAAAVKVSAKANNWSSATITLATPVAVIEQSNIYVAFKNVKESATLTCEVYSVFWELATETFAAVTKRPFVVVQGVQRAGTM